MIRNPQFERSEAVETLFQRLAPGCFVQGVGALRALIIGGRLAREIVQQNPHPAIAGFGTGGDPDYPRRSLASGAADPLSGLGVERDDRACWRRRRRTISPCAVEHAMDAIRPCLLSVLTILWVDHAKALGSRADPSVDVA